MRSRNDPSDIRHEGQDPDTASKRTDAHPYIWKNAVCGKRRMIVRPIVNMPWWQRVALAFGLLVIVYYTWPL